MRGVAISERLRAAASFIEAGSRVVDVGTDHGRLPVWLIQNHITDRVTASDIRPGPLRRAEGLIRRCGLAGRIRLILCDGLDLLDPDEVDTIVLAGLGGDSIRDILARAPWTKEAGKRLILQPAASAEALRGYLFGNGYRILDERLTLDGGRFYQTILASGGRMDRPNDASLYTGIFLRHEAHYRLFLGALIRRFEKACRGIRKASRAPDPEYLAHLERVLGELRTEWEELYGDSRPDL